MFDLWLFCVWAFVVLSTALEAILRGFFAQQTVAGDANSVDLDHFLLFLIETGPREMGVFLNM